jgi:hypothetical protein
VQAWAVEKHMIEQLRYITDEQGARVGVVLGLEAYSRLTSQAISDSELLLGLSQAELKALAESMLTSAAQVRLNDLLARNTQGQLTTEETDELDGLLEQIDQLTILKTRALYTLRQQKHMAAVV